MLATVLWLSKREDAQDAYVVKPMTVWSLLRSSCCHTRPVLAPGATPDNRNCLGRMANRADIPGCCNPVGVHNKYRAVLFLRRSRSKLKARSASRRRKDSTLTIPGQLLLLSFLKEASIVILESATLTTFFAEYLFSNFALQVLRDRCFFGGRTVLHWDNKDKAHRRKRNHFQ